MNNGQNHKDRFYFGVAVGFFNALFGTYVYWTLINPMLFPTPTTIILPENVCRHGDGIVCMEGRGENETDIYCTCYTSMKECSEKGPQWMAQYGAKPRSACQ